MIGTVRIRDLEFQSNHGASAAERRSMRRFQVDVDLSFDVSRAVESDRLADTLNYHDVCTLILETGTAKPHRLLESLAADMVSTLRTRWPNTRVEIELRKLHPPCPGNPTFTAVRLCSDG